MRVRSTERRRDSRSSSRTVDDQELCRLHYVEVHTMCVDGGGKLKAWIEFAPRTSRWRESCVPHRTMGPST